MITYIFDVDGTITPARQKMNHDFLFSFCRFLESHEAWLATGSDRPKTLEQVGPLVYNMCRGVYQCNGNELWMQDQQIKGGSHDFDDIIDELHMCLNGSKYQIRTGYHIDDRDSVLNLSIVGRGATLEQRKHYYEWDKVHNERSGLVKYLKAKHPHYDFCVAGETGIDIYPTGCGKENVLVDFDPSAVIYYFGDNCQAGGNDHGIALAVNDRDNGSRVFEVNGWRDTWDRLKELA